jgi:ABC-2 type transport system permease protein
MSVLRSYRLLVEWQVRRMRLFLPLAVVVQSLLALGIVVGYPLLYPSIDRTTVLFLATGAPTITLILMGLVLVPQVLAQGKTDGTLDYMRTLPVPRILQLLADMTVWLIVVLPGVAFSIVVGMARFGLSLSPSPLLVPGMLLVALTATAIGCAIASLLPPTIANLVTQVLVVFVVMFSPLNFPADRLPSWLAAVHRLLPVQAMGEIVRGTLDGSVFPLPAGAFLLLAAWCAASFAVAQVVLNRRA